MERYRIEFSHQQMYCDRVRHNDKGDDDYAHPNEN